MLRGVASKNHSIHFDFNVEFAILNLVFLSFGIKIVFELKSTKSFVFIIHKVKESLWDFLDLNLGYPTFLPFLCFLRDLKKLEYADSQFLRDCIKASAMVLSPNQGYFVSLSSLGRVPLNLGLSGLSLYVLQYSICSDNLSLYTTLQHPKVLLRITFCSLEG